MCGIAGCVGKTITEEDKRSMLSTMHSRGPDSNGCYEKDACTLLHSRLAIIDIEGGKQPMQLMKGRETYTIVYNGELYNTEEIRDVLIKLGHKFFGHSDTEVVLHAYAQWSEDCLLRFNGIFAFAVWEEKRRKLFLARDRIGVKPLFFTLRNRVIYFASEIKTLLAHPDIDAVIDARSVTQLVMLGPGREPGSGVFKDVHELEPGCFGSFINGKWNWKRYWKLQDAQHDDTFEETAEKVRFLVTDAIQRQMVSDVPIGTFLSGGLDSSLISSVCAAEMKKSNNSLKTFSLDYEDNEKYFVPGKFQPNSDTQYIRIMQDYLNTDHHWSVYTPQALINSLDNATLARDLPGMADVDFSLLLFCGDIKKHVKVALSGECADEIFGGYPWYRDPEIREAEGFPWAQNTIQRAAYIHPQHRGKMDPIAYVNDLYAENIARCDVLPGTSQSERRMKEMVNLNFRWFMQTLLDRKDRMSMFHGLEVRVPFCDYRIAEYLYTVPWDFKDYQGQEKGLLRYAMRGFLPNSILNRKKSPYPKTYDPLYEKLVRDQMHLMLSDSNAPIFEIMDRAAVEHLMTDTSVWPWYGQLMKGPQTMAFMLQINRWMQLYKVSVL